MGTPGRSVADALDAIEAIGTPGEPVTAAELAAELDCDPESARETLAALAERGDVASKELDAGGRVWWPTHRERRARDLERYEAVVETINDGIYVKDEDNRFTLVNQTYAEMVGYDPDELVGRDSSFVVSDEVMEAAERLYADLRAGDRETETIEATLETGDGEPVEAEARFAVIERDDDHERVGVVRDVTERKERERRLQRQKERLESFASMLAHELRNPVAIGQIYAQQLPADSEGPADSEASADPTDSADATDSAPEPVEHVRDAFDRIEDMIDVLLVLARGGDAVGESESVPLADAAREAWAEVEAPDATLSVETDRVVAAEETYVRHLFENLLQNAVEHGSTSNRPEADDAVEHGGSAVTVTVGDLENGFYVADDGEGIPTDDPETVFEAGYTTAETEGGTGVGLTFVKELAGTYDWSCTVTDSESGGARFEFGNVQVESED